VADHLNRPVKSVRLADQVADALLGEIRREALPAGYQLPSEREIGERYGVSRTVVREATRLLLARGVVAVGAGRGLVVAEVDPARASESLSLFLEGRPSLDYASVHEIREVLEVEAARRAAIRATDEGLVVLRAACEAMSAMADSGDVEALSLADVEFHRRLADATGNEIFGVLLDAIAPTLLEPRRTNLASSDGVDEALRGHAEILRSVEAHDADGAADAMRRHLSHVVERWRAAARA
jgi:DNA-binding FadR family transcriptional regulator